MGRLLKYEVGRLRANWLALGVVTLLLVFCVILSGKSVPPLGRDWEYTDYDPQVFYDLPLNQLREFLGESFDDGADFDTYYRLRQLQGIMADTTFPLWIGAVLAAFLIGSDFQTREINAPVMNGHPRFRMVSVKLLLYYGFGIGLSLGSLIATLVFFIRGWGGLLPAVEVLKFFALRAVCDLGTLSIPFLLAFAFRDIIKTISISAAYALVITYLDKSVAAEGGFVEKLLALHPVWQLDRLVQSGEGTAALLVSALVCFAVAAVSACLIFRRLALR